MLKFFTLFILSINLEAAPLFKVTVLEGRVTTWDPFTPIRRVIPIGKTIRIQRHAMLRGSENARLLLKGWQSQKGSAEAEEIDFHCGALIRVSFDLIRAKKTQKTLSSMINSSGETSSKPKTASLPSGAAAIWNRMHRVFSLSKSETDQEQFKTGTMDNLRMAKLREKIGPIHLYTPESKRTVYVTNFPALIDVHWEENPLAEEYKIFFKQIGQPTTLPVGHTATGFQKVIVKNPGLYSLSVHSKNDKFQSATHTISVKKALKKPKKLQALNKPQFGKVWPKTKAVFYTDKSSFLVPFKLRQQTRDNRRIKYRLVIQDQHKATIHSSEFKSHFMEVPLNPGKYFWHIEMLQPKTSKDTSAVISKDRSLTIEAKKSFTTEFLKLQEMIAKGSPFTVFFDSL